MERISVRQLKLIGCMYILTGTLLMTYAQVVKYSKQHAYLSYILAAMIMVLSLWLLAKVMARFPDQDLFQAMIGRFPISGRFIASLYILFFFFILARDIRMLTDFTNVALLPTTPHMMIAVMIVLTIIVITMGGIEIIGRMTELYAPVLILVIMGIPFILIKDFDWTLLMPYFLFDVPGISQGTWIVIGYIGEIVALPFLFSNHTFHLRYGVYSLGLGTALLVIIGLLCLLVLGSQITVRMLYPTYEVVRQLQVTDFLDRFDLPLVGIWLPCMLTKIAYSLYMVCHGIKRILPDVTPKLLVAPIGILGGVCSIWFFQNAIQLFNFNQRWPAISLVFQLFIPILLFLFLKPKRKHRSSSKTVTS